MKYPFKIKYNPKIDRGIEKYFQKAYDINFKYFKMNLPNFKIKIWYSREEFNKHLRFPKNSKFHANSGMKSTDPMDVMSPSTLKEENNWFGQTFFQKLLIHEFCHRFFFQKWDVMFPLWIIEGIACIIAKQERELYHRNKNREIQPLSKIHNLRDWYKYNNYWQAYSMTKFLITKYKKYKLEQLLNLLGHRDSYKIFSKKFEKIYGFSPEEFEKDWHRKMSNLG